MYFTSDMPALKHLSRSSSDVNPVTAMMTGFGFSVSVSRIFWLALMPFITGMLKSIRTSLYPLQQFFLSCFEYIWNATRSQTRLPILPFSASSDRIRYLAPNSLRMSLSCEQRAYLLMIWSSTMRTDAQPQAGVSMLETFETSMFIAL